jgi:hypothetical protein
MSAWTLSTLFFFIFTVNRSSYSFIRRING